ncbi:MAG: YodL domain-containing protein [Ruminococcus sp.]|nr:MAG: YodL domain-containing protein [Ruminococcus sp.]
MLSGKSTGEKLESAFYVFNQERPEDFKGHSLSVSDVVVLDDTAYYVDSVGFKPLKDFIPLEIQQSRFLDTLPQTLKGISDNATELEAVSDKALKLNIPPEIIREACDMVNGGEKP